MIFDGEKQVYILSEQEYDEMFEGNAHANLELIKVRKRLEIATKALEEYAEIETHDWVDSQVVARKALKEMEGVK